MADQVKLTARQREVLETIVRLIDRDGYPPTVRELGAAIGMTSTNGVTDHLKALERKGYLQRRGANMSRGMRVIRRPGEGSMRTRSEAAAAEATRDPVFLFQSRRYVITESGRHAIEASAEDRGWLEDDELGVCRLRGGELESVPGAELVEQGFATEVWETEAVWLDREEAEDWGRTHAYRFPNGWRVYCVPAKGGLAEVLAKAGEEGNGA